MIASVEGTVGRHAEAEATYREHGSRLWRSLVLSFGDAELASDAVAEAFAQLLARGSAVRDPAAWVWRSAFKIAAGQIKERAMFGPMASEGPAELPVDLVDVLRALGVLTPEQRCAVVLADYVGYRHAEIARIVGSTPSAIAVRVHRGRKRLRELLEVHDD